MQDNRFIIAIVIAILVMYFMVPRPVREKFIVSDTPTFKKPLLVKVDERQTLFATAPRRNLGDMVQRETLNATKHNSNEIVQRLNQLANLIIVSSALEQSQAVDLFLEQLSACALAEMNWNGSEGQSHLLIDIWLQFDKIAPLVPDDNIKKSQIVDYLRVQSRNCQWSSVRLMAAMWDNNHEMVKDIVNNYDVEPQAIPIDFFTYTAVSYRMLDLCLGAYLLFKHNALDMNSDKLSVIHSRAKDLLLYVEDKGDEIAMWTINNVYQSDPLRLLSWIIMYFEIFGLSRLPENEQEVLQHNLGVYLMAPEKGIMGSVLLNLAH